jgi:hypothetical protein
MQTQVGLHIFVAQFSETDCRYAYVLVILDSRQARWIVQKNKLDRNRLAGRWCTAVLGLLNIGQLQVPADVPPPQH